MAYLSGTLSSNHAKTIADLLNSTMISQGWTLLDTRTNTYWTQNVYKSPSTTTNGKQWVLCIGQNGTTGIYFWAAEDYDPTTKNIVGVCYSSSYNYNYPDNRSAPFRTHSDYLITDSSITSTGSSFPYVASRVGVDYTLLSSEAYFISITPDGLTGLFSSKPKTIFYLGFYVPDAIMAAAMGDNNYPLVAIADGQYSALSRIAPYSIGEGTVSRSSGPEFGASLPNTVDSGGLSAYCYPCVVGFQNSYNPTGYARIPATRLGTIPNIVLSASPGDSTRGDTMTVNNALYTCASNTSGYRIIAFKQV